MSFLQKFGKELRRRLSWARLILTAVVFVGYVKYDNSTIGNNPPWWLTTILAVLLVVMLAFFYWLLSVRPRKRESEERSNPPD